LIAAQQKKQQQKKVDKKDQHLWSLINAIIFTPPIPYPLQMIDDEASADTDSLLISQRRLSLTCLFD
jgi:hypothetical protein